MRGFLRKVRLTEGLGFVLMSYSAPKKPKTKVHTIATANGMESATKAALGKSLSLRPQYIAAGVPTHAGIP